MALRCLKLSEALTRVPMISGTHGLKLTFSRAGGQELRVPNRCGGCQAGSQNSQGLQSGFKGFKGFHGAGGWTKRLMGWDGKKGLPGQVNLKALGHTEKNGGHDGEDVGGSHDERFIALKKKVVTAARDHLITNALTPALTTRFGYRSEYRSNRANLGFEGYFLNPIQVKASQIVTIDLIFVNDDGFGVVQVEQRVTRDTIAALLGTGEMMEKRVEQASCSPYSRYTVPSSELFIGGCVFDDDAKDFALSCGVNVVELREDAWSVVRSSVSRGGCEKLSSAKLMISWRKSIACKSTLLGSDANSAWKSDGESDWESNGESDWESNGESEGNSYQHSFGRFLPALQPGAVGATVGGKLRVPNRHVHRTQQHHGTSRRDFKELSRVDVSIDRGNVSIDRGIVSIKGYSLRYYTGTIKGHYAGDPLTWKLGGHGRGKTLWDKRERSDGEENQDDGYSARKRKCVTAIYRHLVEHRSVWVDLEDCEVDGDGNLSFVWKFMKPVSVEAAGSEGTVDLIYLKDWRVAVVQVEQHVTRETIGRLLGTGRAVERRLDKAVNGPHVIMGETPSFEVFIGGCVFDDGVKDFALACSVNVVELREEWPIVQSSISKGGCSWF